MQRIQPLFHILTVDFGAHDHQTHFSLLIQERYLLSEVVPFLEMSFSGVISV